MPSGWRSSEPTPVPEHQRQRAEQRGHASSSGSGGSAAGRPGRSPRAASCRCSRSASSAKSIIMIAFFLTMPISRMMPMMRDDAEVVARDQQREQRADARRGQRREDRDRVDVALVEHAQHDVHRDDRREDQQQRVGQRRLERLRRALEVGLRCSAARPSSRSAARDGLHRVAQRRAGRQVERDRRRRELALVVDRRAAPVALDRRGAMRVERHLRACRPDVGDVEVADSAAGPRWNSGLHLEHHAVLVRLREDGRDQPLAERVVQRVVDRRRRDAEPRRPCRGRCRRRPAGPCPAGRWRRRRSSRQRATAGRRCAAPTCASSSGSALSSVNWYCVRLTRSRS